jgi:hypothetical protein
MKNKVTKTLILSFFLLSISANATTRCAENGATLTMNDDNTLSFSSGETFKVAGVKTYPIGESLSNGGAPVSDELARHILSLHKKNGVKLKNLTFPPVMTYSQQGTKLVFVGLYAFSSNSKSQAPVSDILNVGVSYSSDAGITYSTVYLKNCK